MTHKTTPWDVLNSIPAALVGCMLKAGSDQRVLVGDIPNWRTPQALWLQVAPEAAPLTVIHRWVSPDHFQQLVAQHCSVTPVVPRCTSTPGQLRGRNFIANVT